jgi:copper resistance protein B
MKRLSKVLHEKNSGMHRAIFLTAVLMAIGLPFAQAQDDARPARGDMQQKAMPGMDDMDMQGMDMSPAESQTSLPDASTSPAVRDPHAYADGYDFGPIPRPHFADENRFASLLMDRLEWIHASHNTAAAFDLQAWYGRDYDRAVLKAEGDVDGGSLQEARTELLWGHAVASFWDTQLGVRYDSGVDPGRGWLAFGVQGLAPYWFEVDAAAYLGDAGHSALRLSADYELLLTQKLILQPRLEANFYGKDAAARALGSGLSDVAAGIRLRYEIRREFAPYVGIEWLGKYGGTADYARAADDTAEETRLMAGVRFWF